MNINQLKQIHPKPEDQKAWIEKRINQAKFDLQQHCKPKEAIKLKNEIDYLEKLIKTYK